MQRFLMLVAIAVLAAIPALVLRLTDAKVGPIGETAAYGVAILSAGFLLSWGAEAAERHVSQGLIIAIVALVTVLPEYAVDLYYAFQAGKAGPESQYVHYAAANMTGANRLLVGLGWPLLVVMHWTRGGGRAVELSRGNAVEISFLLLASLYAFVIVLKDSITLLDFAVLAAIFGAYVWRVHGAPGADKDEDEEPGPAAAMNTLPVRTQWAVMAGLTLAACVIILASAEPFAEGMVRSGRLLGLNEFLLIQWLAPLASEAPAVTVAVLFVLAGRAANGLGALVSDKINQWTLLVGMLPLALSLGAGTVAALPLDARQAEEFFLTAGQSVFALALLLRLRLGLGSALALAGLFSVQVGLAFAYRNDEARTVATLTMLAWIYLGLAAILFLVNGRRLLGLLRTALPERGTEETSSPKESELAGGRR
ncbi:sodium:proton exchanger [Methylobacterium fujisawaense]|uniref:sodium:proton exchanger n=1 Tax=Methylobacterium fujisawaense TaxID=107400 RepID=UPI00313C6181